MPDNNSERILTITISGSVAEYGRVPLDIISEKIKALQESLYGMANALENLSSSSRGKWSNQVISSCRLVFRDFKKGSLVIDSELVKPIQMSLTEEMDLGLKALRGLKTASKAINNNDTEKIRQLMPNPLNRDRFLAKYKELCPQSDDYQVSIGNGNGRSYSMLTLESRKIIDSFIFPTIEMTTAIRNKIEGRFIEIRIGDEKRHFAINTSQGELSCKYSDEQEKYISQIPPDSLVNIDCEIFFNEDGTIKDIGRVFDVDIINISQPEFQKFNWANKKYILKRVVPGILSFEDGLWVYKVPRYGLHSYSTERKEAYAQINEEFALLCDGLLDEIDDNLTLDAIELREVLKQDIQIIE